MKELIRDVDRLTNQEEKRSMINHPLFNSTHEGYAVIKEEIEEAEAEMSELEENTLGAWHFVKHNNKNVLINIIAMKGDAIRLAAESIQVAAMCQKFIESFKDGVKNE